jgi:hypothetical protein
MRDIRDLVVVKGEGPDWYFAFLSENQDHRALSKAAKLRRPLELEDVRIFHHNLLPVNDRSGSFVGFQEQTGLRCLPLCDRPAKMTLVPTAWYLAQGSTAVALATKLIEAAEKNEAANRSGLALPRG